MLTDIQIAQNANMLPITEVAAKLGLAAEDVIPYGRYKAKLSHKLAKAEGKDGKLILVTAISPTPAGEGKTTTSVGLGDALCALGKRTMLCLREPSLGPVFGIKGGAAGAGFVVVICGSIMTMPGLPKHPAAMDIDCDAEGKITGLF